MRDELREKIAHIIGYHCFPSVIDAKNQHWYYEIADSILALLEGELKGLDAVQDLINNSYGVAGLHLNGDVAPWDELLEGGRFEAWLKDFSRCGKKVEVKGEG